MSIDCPHYIKVRMNGWYTYMTLGPGLLYLPPGLILSPNSSRPAAHLSEENRQQA